MRLANRGRLIIRTPGPVPFGTCICFNVLNILSLTCHVNGPFKLRTSLGTSILLQIISVVYGLGSRRHPISEILVASLGFDLKIPFSASQNDQYISGILYRVAKETLSHMQVLKGYQTKVFTLIYKYYILYLMTW